QIRSLGTDLPRDVEPGEAAGHDDVRQQQFDFGTVFVPDVQRLLAIARRVNPVTAMFEDGADKFAQGVVIFGNEHTFMTACRTESEGSMAAGDGALSALGKGYFESRTLSECAGGFD